MKEYEDNSDFTERRADRDIYRDTLKRVTATIETLTQEVIDGYESREQGENLTKELPAQLLRLVQLIEKASTLLQQIEPVEVATPPQIHYELIRKYLEKNRHVD